MIPDMEATLQENFNQKLINFLENHGNISRLCIALSGGLDSMVLLHLSHHFVKQSGLDLSLHVIHVNHGISKQSDNWQDFCRDECKKQSIIFYAEKVSPMIDGDSKTGIETRARTLRYQVFKNYCQENDLLLMAHQRDDQVETLLFRLFRGNGGKALSGIPEVRELEGTFLLRPLLDVDRNKLALWAEKNNLEWIDDESNQDTYFARNFIREDIISRIKSRWPKLNESLARVSRLQSEQQHLLREVALEDFKNLSCQNPVLTRWGECLGIRGLQNLSKARQKNLLRFWMEERNIQMPSTQRLEQLLASLNQQALPAFEIMSWKDEDSLVSWHGFEEQLFLIKHKHLQEVDETSATWNLPLQSCCRFVQHEYCCVMEQSDRDLLDKRFSLLQVEYRSAGVRCQPVGRNRSQLLKKLFQEYCVPPWERDFIPLFYADAQGEKKLVAVGDLWVCKGFEASEEEGWYLYRQKDCG